MFSPLIDYNRVTSKFSSRQGNLITRIIWHHTGGGSNQGNEDLLATGSRKVSSSYLIRNDQKLVGIVSENHRPWTTGWEADKGAITFETVNTGGSPDWPISDWQLQKGIELCADIALRYEWPEFNRTHLFGLQGHREYTATLCPGPFLWDRFDYIVREVNRIMANTEPPPLQGPLTFAPFENPWRFADTTAGVGPFNPLSAGAEVWGTVPFAAKGLKANVVAVGPSGSGFLSTWGAGQWPGTSSINYNGETVANEIFIPLVNNGFHVLSSRPANLIIDIIGVYN